ncbi:hypothetical protein WJX72_007768 [[Myrmecia] bisecta]|uniref:Zinc finger HIT domain-containing protein n=1 Tax=[Myrmecia] bisecta TaxID=41462 RepID=A0AAW1R804_9CHLO
MRKQPGSNVVVHLLVRLLLGVAWPQQQPAEPAALKPEAETEEAEGTSCLRQEQLELLVGSEELRAMLRDERLQQAIKQIDSSKDREAALDRALQSPNFEDFSNKVLTTIMPDMREP